MTFLLFIGSGVQLTHKTALSVAILCMVNHTALENNITKSSTDVLNAKNCINNQNHNDNNTSQYYPDGPYVWSKKSQGILLSSFFAGYFILQIPAGWLAFKVCVIKINLKNKYELYLTIFL